MIQMMIHGCNGKMGRAIAALARESAELNTCCGVDILPESAVQSFPVYAEPGLVAESVDVVVDFSRPDGLAKLLPWCISRHAGLVLATTGLDAEEQAMVENAARYIPIFRASNMSLGVNVLRSLISSAAIALGEGFDIEIIEKHHNQKVDAPSGTAITLAETITEAIGGTHPLVHGRQGRTSKRTRAEIGMHAIRGGTVTGEHQVHFFGHDESICLTHIAQSREVFAAGALAAAVFLAGKTPGIYGMDDMLRERMGGLRMDCRECLTYLSLSFSDPAAMSAFVDKIRQDAIAVHAMEQCMIGSAWQIRMETDAACTDALLAAARSCTCDDAFTIVEGLVEITVQEPSLGSRVSAADIAAALAERRLYPYRLTADNGRLTCLVPAEAAKLCMETVSATLE